ncbi:uncharacterized protein LOC131537603 [Onychostoma macrolepis]|uniref:uncharacterized protein LOC131537603 n=1 Tax=Onychostoma macrolepis TaxID=369639 RepID=UPI00272CCC48|nr:uncharacterized protein LOC131537603 [Onychostoma macrolepis]
MFGLRTKKQLTTKFSPYFLLFGREARYLCEVPDKFEINDSVEELIAEECISESVKRQDRIYQVVKDNMAQVHAKVKRKLQGKSRVLQVGDRVLRQNIRSQQRKGGKLDPDYVGPYTVLNVDDKSIDLTDDNGKIYPKVNLDHLVHFKEEPPAKIPKVTRHNILTCHYAFSSCSNASHCQVPTFSNPSCIHPSCYFASYTIYPA